ncbi:hypothetical protein [Paenibacillus sp. 1P07SE]|uniref:hypothetical protein n=1 Tax=Paenibacillus sp. 1P07SE TaxID=3132209 RepID=UPI0039A58063
MNLDFRRRSDRVKLFFLLFVSFLTVSLFFVFLSGGFREPLQEAVDSPPVADTDPPTVTEPEPEAESKFADIEFPERQEAKEHLTEQEQRETQEIAQRFAEAYYTHDAERPEQYIEEIQPFVSARLYAAERSAIRRPTLDRERTRVITSEVFPVDHMHDSEIIWSVVIDGEVTAADSTTQPDFAEYFVTLRLYDDDWLVKEYRIESGGDR